jgi:hypothetical protein
MPKAKPSKPSPKPVPEVEVIPAAKKRGRPVGKGGYVPTEQERMLVERMASLAVPHHDMVLLLPSPQTGKKKPIEHISINTLLKHYPEELKKGSLRTSVLVLNAFYKSCVGDPATGVQPSVAAQIWYTKTRLGWREAQAAPPVSEQPETETEEAGALEVARRVAFTLALGYQKTKKTG